MADKGKSNQAKKARHIALQKELADLERIWKANARNDDNRYQSLEGGSQWMSGGIKQMTAQEGVRRAIPFLRSEEEERESFRKQTLVGAPAGLTTRAEVVARYRAVKAEYAKLDSEVGAQVKTADPNTQGVDPKSGRVIQTDPVTGKPTAYDEVTGEEISDFEITGVETLDGSKPRALTNADIEDIFRTSNPDITPDVLADLYPEYNAEGMQINEANPLAFTDAKMVRWDDNPNYAGDARWQAYQKELRRVLGERRRPGTPLDTRPSIQEIRTGRAPAQVDHGGRRGSPGQSAAINRETMRRTGMSRADIMSPKEITYSFREAFGLPFTWTPTQVSQMATRLFMAGYMPQLMGSYDPTKPLSEQYPGGLSDPYNPIFRGAYMDWMKDSMATRDKTSMQILAEREKSTGEFFSEMRRVAEEEKNKELARRIATYTQLTDPDRINSLVDQLGQALIGRKLSPGEKAQYVSLIHSQQSAYGLARANAEVEGTGLSQTEVDVQATLEAEIRGDNPVEAMGKDVADQYNEFRKLLGGPLAMM